MSEAIELYKQNGESAGIFFCSECRVVHPNKDQAAWCHGERLCQCGKKITQGYYNRRCSDCAYAEFKAKEAARETERFEKANKISEAEYTGEHVYDGGKYYDTVKDAIDGYLAGQEPEYVWACESRGIPKADLEDVTCNILDNMWEDADSSDLEGVEELEAALSAFNKANEHLQVWEPDYSTAILVERAK